eukprot:403355683
MGSSRDQTANSIQRGAINQDLTFERLKQKRKPENVKIQNCTLKEKNANATVYTADLIIKTEEAISMKVIKRREENGLNITLKEVCLRRKQSYTQLNQLLEQKQKFLKSKRFILKISDFGCQRISTGVIAYLQNMELPKEYGPLAESLGDELQKKMPFFEERLQKPLKNNLAEIGQIFYQMNKARQYSAGDYTMPQEFEEAIENNDEKFFMTKQQMAQQDSYLQSLDILKDCIFRREVNKYGEIFVGIYKQDSIEGFSQAKSYSKFYGRYYSQDYVIEGFFKNGNFEGEGYEYGLNTERINYYFDGEFLKSKSNGIGTTIYIEGDMYYGQFKNGKRNGLGTYYWDYGDVFEGQWRDHYKNGEGVLKYANGDIIRGPWKDDYIQGEHVLTYVDGKLEKIIFEMGKEISSEEIIIP